MNHIETLRKSLFFALAEHPLRHREMKNFNAEEIAFATAFIKRHSALGFHDYVSVLNRYVIADERVRPNQRTKLWGCLHEAATGERKHYERGYK